MLSYTLCAHLRLMGLSARSTTRSYVLAVPLLGSVSMGTLADTGWFFQLELVPWIIMMMPVACSARADSLRKVDLA
jgi:hypothetical protein